MKIKMSNETYDALKRVAGVWLPMIAAIVIGVGEIWVIPVMAPIGATITLIDAALGVALDKLSKEYQSNEE